MTITEITEVNKARYRVTLDDGTHFVLYKGELHRFQLKQDGALSEEDYESIFHEILPKRAKLRCMNLLKTKDYTRKQLEDKLRQGGYPAEIVETAIACVESCGYVNDENYVRNFIECHLQTRSRKRIENDLQQKGIRRELISQAFDELSEDGLKMDETAVIQKILLKKNFCAGTATDKERQKMCGFLYRKGFQTDAISRALLLDIT
ncbi:MAG: recombination regulator RecX [Blautia sp.]|nr:recombination regulator RecX [Blautia sp.]MCM1201551.1 recombination regulator RecX [Bacteroides fragilis]